MKAVKASNKLAKANKACGAKKVTPGVSQTNKQPRMKALRRAKLAAKKVRKVKVRVAAAGVGDEAAIRDAGLRLVGFLENQSNPRLVESALKKVLSTRPSQEALGMALGHCAGRGLHTCVEKLLEVDAPMNMPDPAEPLGRATPLQLAVCRSHLNVVRLLVQAGADRTGALECCDSIPAVLQQERRAIEKALRS